MPRSLILNGLHGRDAHVEPIAALEGLDWRTVGKKPLGADYSIWQLVLHMVFWQDLVLGYLKGEKKAIPKAGTDSWPDEEEPRNPEDWEGAKLNFFAGLKEAEQEAEKDWQECGFGIGAEGMTRGELLGSIICHNSYHLGQVVLLRKILGAWPPPGQYK